MRNADRPTQPPPQDSRPADPAATTEKADPDDSDTRVQFLSWDAPLVPDHR
jgi:hypothetical protein